MGLIWTAEERETRDPGTNVGIRLTWKLSFYLHPKHSHRIRTQSVEVWNAGIKLPLYLGSKISLLYTVGFSVYQHNTNISFLSSILFYFISAKFLTFCSPSSSSSSSSNLQEFAGVTLWLPWLAVFGTAV